MSDPKHPQIGDLHIDASDVAPVVDITPEHAQKLTKVRDGYVAAANCILGLKSEDVERAGLNEKDIKRLGDLLATDARLSELLPPAEKMAELLKETRQVTRHEIGTLLGELAAQTRRRADRSPSPGEVLGPLDKLLEYQYGPAEKAAATKDKAKEATAEQGKEPK